MQPETKFARLGGDRIAYQVLGKGPPDLVLARRSYGHVDVAWEDPGITLFLRTLASFCRLILFDRRGTGPSDPLPLDPLPPWEPYAEELAAVLDEVGSERAAIMAELDAGPTALLFAGTRPERTGALVLVHTSARFVAASDYPIGVAAEDVEALVARFDQLWAATPWPPCWHPAAPVTRAFSAGSPSGSVPASAPGPPRRSCGPWPRSTCGPSCRWCRRRP